MRRSKSFASDSKPRKDFWVIARLDIKPIKKLCLKIIEVICDATLRVGHTF